LFYKVHLFQKNKMGIEITQDLLGYIGEKLNCDIIGCKILGHGEHNMNYTLETNNGRFVLRICANTLLKNLEKEFYIMKELSGKFSPKVFYLDISKKLISQDYMIQEFIDGKALSSFDESNIVRVANLLKNVHEIKNPEKDREWDNLISRWAQNNLLENSKFLGQGFHEEIKSLYNEVLERLEKIKPFLEGHSRTSLIHDDPIPANFIEKKNGELILIDWELAAFDYYFFDFGGVIAEGRLDKDLEKIFLESYGFTLGENEAEIIQSIKINRILSVISWLIERIAVIKQGKNILDFEDTVNYEERLEDELEYIKVLLEA